MSGPCEAAPYDGTDPFGGCYSELPASIPPPTARGQRSRSSPPGPFSFGWERTKPRDRLGHGKFLPWIDSEFEMSSDTAERFMRVAKSREHAGLVSRLSGSGGYPTRSDSSLSGFLVGGGSFVLTAIFRDLLLALMKPLHYRRSPWYQHGLICKALPKVSMILLHDVENRFLGELSMVLGKLSVHSCELFIGHGSHLGR